MSIYFLKQWYSSRYTE